MVGRDERHDDMLKLLVPDDTNEGRDPLLQRNGQPNKNRGPVFSVAPSLALTLKNDNLRPSKREQLPNKIGRAALDGRHPSRGYLSLLDPLAAAILNGKQELSGKVRAQIR